jgi:hypothetical protein
VKTPDNKSDKGHHACFYESDRYDTDTVCIAKTGGLEFRQVSDGQSFSSRREKLKSP